MRIVVDTNRVIAALIKDSVSRKIILSGKADFITINVIHKEIAKYRSEIMQRTNLNLDEFQYLLIQILNKMTIISDEGIGMYMSKAKEIMDNIDPADTPFVAAALAADAFIWTDDKHFENQNAVKIIKTRELVKKL